MLNNDISLYYTYMYVLTIKKTHYDVPKLKNVLERSRKRECAKIFTSWPIVLAGGPPGLAKALKAWLKPGA